MKRADSSTSSGTTPEPIPSKPPEIPPARKPQDARGHGGQQERNRQDMNVEDDHRTKAMKKGKRGTFP